MKIKAKEVVSDKAFAFESNPTSMSNALKLIQGNLSH